MAEFTFLEVHLDDASFSVDAPFVGETESTETDDATDEEDSGGFPILPIVGVLALVVVAVAAKKALGGDDPDIDVE